MVYRTCINSEIYISGKATVVGLVTRGAKVYMGARTETKASEAIREIQNQLPQAVVRFLALDLSDLKSVVAAASIIRREETALHGLVNNAGVMGTPFSETKDGYEIQFQVRSNSFSWQPTVYGGEIWC